MDGRKRLFNHREILIYVLSDLGLNHIEEEQYSAAGDTWAKTNQFHVKHIPLHRPLASLHESPRGCYRLNHLISKVTQFSNPNPLLIAVEVENSLDWPGLECVQQY